MLALIGPGNAELSHARLQCRPLHTELRRRTVWPADCPIAFFERAQYMLALRVF